MTPDLNSFSFEKQIDYTKKEYSEIKNSNSLQKITSLFSEKTFFDIFDVLFVIQSFREVIFNNSQSCNIFFPKKFLLPSFKLLVNDIYFEKERKSKNSPVVSPFCIIDEKLNYNYVFSSQTLFLLWNFYFKDIFSYYYFSFPLQFSFLLHSQISEISSCFNDFSLPKSKFLFFPPQSEDYTNFINSLGNPFFETLFDWEISSNNVSISHNSSITSSQVFLDLFSSSDFSINNSKGILLNSNPNYNNLYLLNFVYYVNQMLSNPTLSITAFHPLLFSSYSFTYATNLVYYLL
jgi:hypothetical protein